MPWWLHTAALRLAWLLLILQLKRLELALILQLKSLLALISAASA